MIYTIDIIRSIRKSIVLKIDKLGNIIIKAPFFVTKGAINTFIENKQIWIEKRRSELKSITVLNFECGDEILFLGEKCKIKKLESTKVNIYYEDNIFYIKKDLSKSETQKVLKDYFKKKAMAYITNRTKSFVQKYSLEVNSIKIGSAKSRWGSCTSKKDIRFTYLLMSAPILSIDYVIIHELSHLKEMNHSSAFWNEVERMMSDYKIHKNWFKKNRGMSLF